MAISGFKLKAKTRSLIAGVLVMVALTACSTYPDKNIDSAKNNKSTFQQDAIECARAYPELGSGSHVPQRIDCMKLKGWR